MRQDISEGEEVLELRYPDVWDIRPKKFHFNN